MLFTEFRFLPFFLLAFVVAWALRGDRSRKTWLLACSYGFYAGWDWRFLGLIVLSTLVDSVAGLRIHASDDAGTRRRWLFTSLGANLGILGFFKYFHFFHDSASAFSEWLGFSVSPSTLHIVLPVGISFFTFQTMSYSIDIYRRRLAPAKSLLDLALFVGFFPQLVAGPIVRARDFLPQLLSRPVWSSVPVRACLVLFLSGFIKKACVADYLAQFVDRYFAAPGLYDAHSAWIGVTFYAAQIYCDFSGYSDMAIATAGLLGYTLPLNFAFPYLAGNITDFWRRWHISLSTWLRDYLYIPLGGSRGGKLATQRNLMLTMLLGGLWHGAALNFIIWGGLHGVALMAHKAFVAVVGDAFGGLRRVVGPVLTFYWVCVTWIFFRTGSLDLMARAERFDVAQRMESGDMFEAVGVNRLAEISSVSGMAAAQEILRAFVLFESPGELSLDRGLVWVMAVLLVGHLLAWRRVLEPWWRRAPDWAFAASYGVCCALAIHFVAQTKTFIYFQF